MVNRLTGNFEDEASVFCELPLALGELAEALPDRESQIIDHQALTFDGRPLDPAIALESHPNRHHDPAPGLWVTEEPVACASGDENLSRYVATDASDEIPSGPTRKGEQ